MKRLIAAAFLCVTVCAGAQEKTDLQMWETYAQYVPLAADALLYLAGAPTDDSFWSICASAGIAGIGTMSVAHSIKLIYNEPRPDGGDRSFPSGHTAASFAGAELIRLHYGWGWGAGAYCLATAVGASRIIHNRHWWWDTLAGAAIGISVANLTAKGTRLWVSPVLDPFMDNLYLKLVYRF